MHKACEFLGEEIEKLYILLHILEGKEGVMNNVLG